MKKEEKEVVKVGTAKGNGEKKEIQKAIFISPELVWAIEEEAKAHHRTWMREVQNILEEAIWG